MGKERGVAGAVVSIVAIESMSLSCPPAQSAIHVSASSSLDGLGPLRPQHWY